MNIASRHPMLRCPRRHRFSAGLLVGWLLLSPSGFVGAAISPSSLAATGDLALLAATSQRQALIQRMAMGKKTLETLSFELEQNRVLLSTLTAGSRLDLTVGGNLAAQGIRSGATDTLSPEALQTGQAAVTALINSGLLTVKNQPAVQAALNAPTPNGAALTYTDTAGTVSLTLAGQAKVQAVYSQLTLTETFDVTHFPDQQTAQIVTLVAAIVLTICTGGAGAGTLGAAMAGVGTTSAAMINAAVIGMMSTMTGQLAGGASFDAAFQAGVKAGATSAITAGVSYGVSDYLGLNPQLDASGNVLKDSTGNVVYQTTAGADYAKLSTLGKLGDSKFWTMAAANTTASGVASMIHGGTFSDGLKGGAIGVAGSTLNTAVGDWGAHNGLAPGDLSKVALHASIGAAQAKLSGRDPLAGAIGAAAAEALSPLANSLDKSTGNRAAGELTTALGGLAANALLNKDNPLDMTAAYQALQTDRFNRQLHNQETSTLRAAAKALAEKTATERGLTAEQQKQFEGYWFDQLRAEANASVDPNAAKNRQDFLNQVTATNQAGYAGRQGAGNYLSDAQIARSVVEGLAGTLILGTDGKPIIADGGELRAFQATTAQYNDSKLFYAGDTATLKQQFGSVEAANAASVNASRAANIRGAIDSNSRNSALLAAYRTPSEGVAVVVPEAYLIGTGGIARSLVSTAVNAGKVALGRVAAAEAAAGVKGIANPVSDTLARVVPANLNPTTLGKAGDLDVFVTNASELRGLSNAQIANKLTIPEIPGGFKVIEFPSSSIDGIASPVFRTKPGFLQGGRTAGGAAEFVIPNGPIPAGATQWIPH